MNQPIKFKIFFLTLVVIIFVFPSITKAASGCCKVTRESGAFEILASEVAYLTLESEDCEKQKGPNTEVIFEEGKQASSDKKSCEDASVIASKATPSKPTVPQLQVSIPGFGKFSDVTCDNPEVPCEFPWIGEYIKAIYDYGLAVVGILSVIVMMIGGIIRLTAGGNHAQISQGNTYIKSSILGVIFTLCSYMILFIVNPNLTILRPINVNYLERIELPEIDLSKSAEELGIPQTLLDSLRGQNPYQEGCGNIERCRQYGSSRPSHLIKVSSEHGNVYLDPQVYDAFKKSLTCVDPNETKFTITDGWRSAEAQIDVKKRKPTLAATPCCSNHGGGLAMDLARGRGGQMSWSYNESSGLKRCMNQNGLQANLTSKPNEPWHWSPTGK